MKKLAIHFYKRAIQITIVLILLLAAYVVAGRMLLPMLQDYRSVVERDLSELLGVSVRVEEIEGSFRGFDPALVARHVDILSGTNEPGFSSSLHLESLTVELDFFQTLRKRDLVFRELIVSGLELYVHQSSDGRWQLTGWESENTADSSPSADDKDSAANDAMDASGSASEVADNENLLALVRYLKLVERQDHIAVTNATVHLQPFENQARSLEKLQFDLYDLDDGRIQLDVSGRVGFQQDVYLMAIIGGEFDSLQSLRVNAYLHGSMLEFAPWLHMVPQVSPPLLALNLKPEFWLNWDGEQWELNGSADIGHIELTDDEELHSISDLSIDVSLRYRDMEQWQLWLNDIAFTVEGYQWPESEIYIEGSADGVVEVTTPGFDLALIKNILLRGEVLSGMPQRVLSTLNPSGWLEQIRFRYLPRQEDFEVTAHLRDVSVDAWGEAPYGHGINGIVHASKASGYLQLDSEEFTLGLLKLFREPWHYREASGFLHWVIADNQYSLITENILLVGDEGEVHGQFRLDIPFDERPVTMGLQAGISNGDVRYAGKYIPVGESGLSKEVVSWLDKGLLAGTFNQGSFIMNGALEDTEEVNDFTIGLFFNLEQADVHYVDDWPNAENVTALVVINDDEVRVDATEGEVWGAQIAELAVHIPASPGDTSPVLSVQGTALSNSASAMRLLRESPINETLGGEAEFWQLGGDIKVGLNLTIPLGPGEDRYQVGIAFDNNRFFLQREQLQLENLTGVLNYDSAKGLYSDPMAVTLLGGKANVQAVANKGAPDVVQFLVDGNIALDNLYDWFTEALGADPASMDMARDVASGETTYKGNLVINQQPSGSEVTLVVESPLQGVEVLMPQPVGKEKQSVRPFRLQLATDIQQIDQTTYTGHYGKVLDWRLISRDGQIHGANLSLGGAAAKAKVGSVIRVQGHIEELILKPWVDWAIQSFGEEKQSGGDTGSYSVLIDNLTIDQLDAYDQQIAQLQLNGEINETLRVLDISSPVIAGTVRQKVADSLYEVHVKHIHLEALDEGVSHLEAVGEVDDEELVSQPAPINTELEPDPLQEFDPRQVPNMNITIDELKFGEDIWGNIAANLRPYEEGLHAFNVAGRIRATDIKGDLSWAYSNGIHRTYVKGDLSLENMADVLNRWHYPSFIESKSGSFQYDLNWAGSPAAISQSNLEGTLNGELIDGQFVDTGQSTRALRVLGVLNINNISRRLSLDFSDLFSDGISFDRTTIPFKFDNGVLTTNEHMLVEGTGSDFKFTGSLDANQNVIDAELVVTLPVTSTLPILGLVFVNPIFGGAMLVFDQLLGDEIQKFASVKYIIKGNADNPEITMDRLFGRQ